MSLEDLEARISILMGEERIDDYPEPPIVDRTLEEDDDFMNDLEYRLELLRLQSNRNQNLEPWMIVTYDASNTLQPIIEDNNRSRKKKTRKKRRKRKKRRHIKLFKKKKNKK